MISDSEDESAFIALNISMVTRMLRDIVEADCDSGPVKIEQLVDEKAEAAPHWWK